ncbi:MAG: response regulator [Capsulimonadales bacterium]|nr:response regulator [Capsulimonadales bacterium]
MAAKKILIIEDNPVNMELATDLLDMAGHTTLQAEDAEKGIRIAREEMPDLILMDIQLPGMDGLQATTILKNDPDTRHLRIVALTAHAMKGDEERALSLGCLGYITKPINTRSFSRLVTEFCDVPVDELTTAEEFSGLVSTSVPENTVETLPTPIVPASVEGIAPEPLTLEPESVALEAIALEPEPLALEPEPLALEALALEPMALEAIALDPEPLALEPEPVALEALALEAIALDPEPLALEPEPLALEALALDPEPVKAETAPEFVEGFRKPSESSTPDRPFGDIPLPPPTETPFLYTPRRGRGRRQREFVAPTQETPVAKILVVDDDMLNREMISAQLRTLGYESMEIAEDGFQALDMVDETFDLVLLDYMMPGMDGCEVVRRIRDEKRLMDLPVVMVTALSSRDDQLRAVDAGANDWITKPVDRTELSVRVRAHLRFKAAQDALKKHQRDLETTVKSRTSELRRALEQVTAEQDRTNEAYLDTMHRLALAAEFRDGFMAASHIRCVGNYCAAIARSMNLPDLVAQTLLHAAPIHDIGILSVPESVLLKGEQRTPEEEAIYRDHTVMGARLLSGARSELLRAGEVIALTHHEKWDGSGFPHGRDGENIPLFGRICAVADTFDTITAYNGGEWQASNEDAREVLLAGRGTDFDPQVIDAFFRAWDEILTLQRRFRRTEAPPADLMPRLLARV